MWADAIVPRPVSPGRGRPRGGQTAAGEGDADARGPGKPLPEPAGGAGLPEERVRGGAGSLAALGLHQPLVDAGLSPPQPWGPRFPQVTRTGLRTVFTYSGLCPPSASVFKDICPWTWGSLSNPESCFEALTPVRPAESVSTGVPLMGQGIQTSGAVTLIYTPGPAPPVCSLHVSGPLAPGDPWGWLGVTRSLSPGHGWGLSPRAPLAGPAHQSHGEVTAHPKFRSGAAVAASAGGRGLRAWREDGRAGSGLCPAPQGLRERSRCQGTQEEAREEACQGCPRPRGSQEQSHQGT